MFNRGIQIFVLLISFCLTFLLILVLVFCLLDWDLFFGFSMLNWYEVTTNLGWVFAGQRIDPVWLCCIYRNGRFLLCYLVVASERIGRHSTIHLIQRLCYFNCAVHHVRPLGLSFRYLPVSVQSFLYLLNGRWGGRV